MNTVLVTGGSGFISGAIARYLIKQNFIVDILTKGDKPVLFSGYRNHFIGDRRSKKFLEKNLKNANYDFVFDVVAYTSNDVKKLVSVLDTESIKKFIFCSSAAVYMPSRKPLAEDSLKGYNDVWQDYGYNKLKAENFLFNLYKKKSFPVIIFRPTYVYGPNNNLYREAYFFDRIMNNQPIPVPASNNEVQFVFINDLVKTFISAININAVEGQAFNLAFPQKISWLKLINTAARACKKKPIIKKINTNKTNKLGISVRSFFPFRDTQFLLSTMKLKKAGLYFPKINLSIGLKKSFAWYSKVKPVFFDSKLTNINKVI